jgi:L-ribulose-5-phosphate 3-epimerase
LSPPEDGRFQAFPRRSWLEEFPRAREASLDYIEWIRDEYGPVHWLVHGLPLIRCTTVELVQRGQPLHKLIPIHARIGASRIVLPFVDQSKITTEDEKQVVIDVLKRALLSHSRTMSSCISKPTSTPQTEEAQAA